MRKCGFEHGAKQDQEEFNMLTNKRIKRICKEIGRQQSAGIEDGDICPRCGQPVMNAAENNYFVRELGVYLCGGCGLDLSFAAFSSEEENPETWAMVAGDETFDTHPDDVLIKTVTIHKFRKNDRIIDVKSDWPGVILKQLPGEGLYEVRPDGKDEDIIVLKDREMVFDLDLSKDRYYTKISERIQPGQLVEIDAIKSGIAPSYAKISGVVEEILENGAIRVAAPSEILVIYPDMDQFHLYKEIKLEAEGRNKDPGDF